jgi:hypothetical protein
VVGLCSGCELVEGNYSSSNSGSRGLISGCCESNSESRGSVVACSSSDLGKKENSSNGLEFCESL